MMIAAALTIAGSDSGGGAGIQADLKTFAAHGVYGACAITALTAQNTRGVQDVMAVPTAFVQAQLQAVLSDMPVKAVKIGMLHNAEIVRGVAELLEGHPHLPVVLDPVLVSSSGRTLLDADGVAALKEKLFPLVDLLTPNLPEAAVLLGGGAVDDIDAVMARRADFLALGAGAVLVKGGHGKSDILTDVLITHEKVRTYDGPRLDRRNTHGTGCTLSSAIAANLARGMDLAPAVAGAHAYLQGAIRAADEIDTGAGKGAVHHFHAIPGWRDGYHDG